MINNLGYNTLAYYKLAYYIITMERENLDRNFGFILNDVSRLMRTTFDRRAKSIGLNRSQWWVLTHLYRRDGLVQAELAEILEIERPTLGRLLDRLRALDCVALDANHRELTPEIIDQAHAAGFRVCCYTVNDLDRAHLLWSAGLDGLITDWVDRISPA